LAAHELEGNHFEDAESMNLSRFVRAFALTALFAAGANLHAKITLPKIVGDHMVLQRGMAAPIWGRAAPGEKISVRADWRRRTATATAGADGRWMVKIPTPKAGGPHTITIQGGSEKIVLHDVLIGEVWVCSGQSNMEFPVGYYSGGYSGATNWENELQHADFPDVRLFTVQNAFALSPQFDCEGNWTNCNADTAEAFSAVAFFFGRELHEKLKVPVGLVDSDFGGTVCEAWTSADTLNEFPDFADALKAEEMERDHSNELAQANAAKLSEWSKQIEPADGAATNAAPDLDDSSWSLAPNLGDDQSNVGFITFRKEFDLPADWQGRDSVLELGPVDDMDFTYLNGVKIGRTVGELTWSRPRVYQVPASALKPGTNVLTVCVLNTGGPGGVSGPVRLHPANDSHSLSLDHDWRFQAGVKYSALPQLILPPRADANSPSVLFNAMIAPLIPFGIRGAMWYQGESNIGRAAQYRRLFPAMIADWRRHWGEGNFPFYFVQIAPFRYSNPGMAADLREAQLLSMGVSNTGMAVTMDSDSNNLHPRNKQPVGHRLALWALAKTYGEKNLVFSGPIYRSMKVEGSQVRLFFDYTDGGLTSGGKPLEHFTIAGADGKFVPARAEIDGDTIVVSSDAVPHPMAVRYAWGDADESSFGNQAGLPAPSFRTDAPAPQ
jgi:sialate O-acetylesterase